MNEKKRGIRLKPVNEGQEGYQALIDFFAEAGLPAPREAQGERPPVGLVSAVPQGIGDRPRARRELARRLREELEETLRLLEQALPDDGDA